MDERILQLFEALGLPSSGEQLDFPHKYDCSTPFEKCTVMIDVPTTVSNNTSLTQ
ncbi:MAG: hypothetical protein FWC70_11300 [Defluviitaleaceae bacterium]|nr:hypothetical protein [Defluviitaleaceae bacterium]